LGANLSLITKILSELRRGGGEETRLCLVGQGRSLGEVAAALSEGAADLRDGFSRSLDLLPPEGFPRDPALAGRWDVVVLVAPGVASAALDGVARAAREAGAAVVGYDPAPAAAGAGLGAVLRPSEVARSLGRAGDPGPTLAARIAAAAGDGGVGLAARLPFLRRAVVDRVILSAARQNAVIGVVVIIPGADMPAMTANQVRMILRIAASYGEQLGRERAVEILTIVGAGFAMRTLARQALTYVPGFGWALKGAIGYTGTVALGRAAIAYFEAGAPLTTTRVTKIARGVERLRARLPGGLAAR
jgi:uncharacterized protein (DUF697 family)